MINSFFDSFGLVKKLHARIYKTIRLIIIFIDFR